MQALLPKPDGTRCKEEADKRENSCETEKRFGAEKPSDEEAAEESEEPKDPSCEAAKPDAEADKTGKALVEAAACAQMA